MNKESQLLDKLQSLSYIRVQARRVLSAVKENQSLNFRFHPDRMLPLRDYVLLVLKANYPDLRVPYHSRWRHFEVGGVDRVTALKNRLTHVSSIEKGKIFFELAIISVLLDAGAGYHWSYYDKETQNNYSRSEGLAIASLDWYLSGAFSCQSDAIMRVDADALQTMNEANIKEAFQVNDSNPLEGLNGRLGLLKRLAAVLVENPDYFGSEGRLGNLYAYFLDNCNDNCISAETIFNHILKAFRNVWPKRLELAGISLGDVWECSILEQTDAESNLMPFHKLTQWLTYSLLEPFEWNGLSIRDMNVLTGLPEYRNGGLLIDFGVLELMNPEDLKVSHQPASDLIVEWRALTVAILDDLASSICEALNSSESDFPLAKVLQGGTWAAGRQIANEKRQDGRPPLSIISDGTVF